MVNTRPSLNFDWLHRKNLKILDANGGLIAMICCSMPENLRKDMFPNLQSVFGDSLKSVNTMEMGEDNEFLTYNFDYWNRYCTDVSGINTVSVKSDYCIGNECASKHSPGLLKEEGEKKNRL